MSFLEICLHLFSAWAFGFLVVGFLVCLPFFVVRAFVSTISSAGGDIRAGL